MRNEIQDSLISQILPTEPSKSQKTKIKMIEAAIKIYNRHGFERTTYEMIARECGLSRPLIVRYFPERNDLFEMSIKMIRAQFQALAVQAISSQPTIETQFEAYVRSTFVWLRKYPSHAKVWLLFFYYCSVYPKYRKQHTSLVDMGHERIVALIETGNKTKVFKCKKPKLAAKLIQSHITGALVTLKTEDFHLDEHLFETSILNECVRLLHQ